MESNELISINQLAKILRVASITVYYQAVLGNLPQPVSTTYEHGRKNLYNRQDIINKLGFNCFLQPLKTELEAAEYLGCSVELIKKLCNNKPSPLKFYQIFGYNSSSYRFFESDLECFKNSNSKNFIETNVVEYEKRLEFLQQVLISCCKSVNLNNYLNDNEKNAINLYYIQGMSMIEIGAKINLTSERIRVILNDARNKILSRI